jgi:CHAD domain-containing protein
VLAHELAAEVLQTHANVLVEHARAGQWDQDPEEIHQARVASRRLRAGMRVFEDVLPESVRALSPELKWIAGLLGAVRDLDVQVRRLQTTAAELRITQDVVPYGGWLEALRERALAELDDATRSSPRYAEALRSLENLTVPAPTEADHQLTAEEFAPAQLKNAARKLRKQVRRIDQTVPDAVVHKARIRAKRLRYAVEFFEPIYGKRARRVIRATTDVQDLLGDHQDGVVNTGHIHEAIATAAAGWPAETSLALGQLVQWEAQHRAELRHQLAKVYGDVEDAWRTLGKAL